MKIRFSCPGCNKAYAVDQGLAGKKAKCKQCGNSITVPQPPPEDDFLPVQDAAPAPNVAPVQPGFAPPTDLPKSNPFSTAFPQAAGQAAPQQAMPTPIPAPNSPAAYHPSFGNADPPGGFLMGDTMASNPGQLKVSKLRYAQCYPLWFFIWHGLALVSVLLAVLHTWWWMILVVFAFACVWFYWYRIKMQFQHGCANPAKVVSLNPPLIAAYTDLTKGAYELHVVKICEQPIGKMSTGNPTVGQQVATVAFYEDRFDEGPHWSTFDPKPAACVSSNQQRLDQMMQSFDAEDWQQLDFGLSQIPQPFKAGHYRIYTAEEFQRPGMSNPSDIYSRVLNYVQMSKSAKAFGELNEDEQKGVLAYTNNMPAQDIWCVLVSTQMSQMYKQGMALTAHGIYFNYKAEGKGAIPWANIVGAMSSNDGLEIMLRDKRRFLISESHFLSNALETLDVTIDAIAGRLV